MEKKQLFDSSLVGFHPEIFNPYLQISVDIGNNDYTSNFSIDQTILVDDDFINNYNNTPINSIGVLAINMTYNGDQTVRHIMNFVKGNNGSHANHLRNGFIYYISINNINTVGKTIDLTITSRSNNTVVRLTTTVNGLTNLNPGDFNETVTLTDEEYNALKEVPVREIFMLINNIDFVSFLVFKIDDNSFRANRDYIDGNLSNRSLISFFIELGENNQATFKGNINKLMDPNNYLAKDNTTEYTPTADYNPATKKYVDDKYYRIEQSGRFDLDLIIGGARYDHALKYSLSLNMSGNTYTVILEILNTNNEALAYKIISDDRQDSIVATNQLAYINTTFTYDSSYFANKLTVNLILDSTINIDFKDKTIGLTINSITAKCLSTIVTETEYSKFTDTNDNILYFVTPN